MSTGATVGTARSVIEEDAANIHNSKETGTTFLGMAGEKFHILLLGCLDSGKSSFTLRFTDRRYVENYDPEITDIYNCTKYQIEGISIDINIVDTTTSKFDDLVFWSSTYHDKADAICFCFDSASEESFKQMKLCHSNFNHIRQKYKFKFGANAFTDPVAIPTFVFGLKSDLAWEEYKEVQRVVLDEFGDALGFEIMSFIGFTGVEEFCEAKNMDFFKISARTGENVNESIEHIVRKIARWRREQGIMPT